MKTDKCVVEVVQTFREAQNLLPTLYTHLSALENIMVQQTTLTGAARRRAQCFATPANAAALHCLGESDDGEVEGEATIGPSCAHRTTPVMTSPIGVLAAFAPSTVHHLVAQHERDAEELLGVVSRITQQSWPQKVEQLKSKVAQLEQRSDTASGAAPTIPNSSRARGPRRPSLSDTQVTAAGSASATAGATSSYFASAPELSAALYGFLACLLKMGSVLQEVMLALRKDAGCFLMAPSGSAASTATAETADHLTAVLVREGDTSAAVGLLPVRVSDAVDQTGVAGPASRRSAHLHASAQLQAAPMNFVEAVGRLQSFLESRWAQCCDDLLVPESRTLLTIL